jgi:hypothetical protein
MTTLEIRFMTMAFPSPDVTLNNLFEKSRAHFGREILV